MASSSYKKRAIANLINFTEIQGKTIGIARLGSHVFDKNKKRLFYLLIY